MSGVARRWTVSVHRVGSGFSRSSADHLDWFFEKEAGDDDLTTFASGLDESNWMTADATTVVNAASLLDHRRVYLDHRGEVSGNRGTITPIAGGEFRGAGDNVFRLDSVEFCRPVPTDFDLAAVVRLVQDWLKQEESVQTIQFHTSR